MKLDVGPERFAKMMERLLEKHRDTYFITGVLKIVDLDLGDGLTMTIVTRGLGKLGTVAAVVLPIERQAGVLAVEKMRRHLSGKGSRK